MAHWLPRDSQLLIALVEERGKKWGELTNYFPGRSATQLRNRHIRIVAGRSRVNDGLAKNLCRLCGEVRASHICKGRSGDNAQHEAAMRQVQDVCKAAAAIHAENNGVVKQSRPGRSAASKRGASLRASWLPKSTGTTADQNLIVDFIEGGVGV